jgi:hypothetical protein
MKKEKEKRKEKEKGSRPGCSMHEKNHTIPLKAWINMTTAACMESYQLAPPLVPGFWTEIFYRKESKQRRERGIGPSPLR